MSKKKTGSVFRKLIWRKMLSQKGRNLAILCAICLTCILFTSVCAVYATIDGIYNQNARMQVGTSEHATLKKLTKEQVELFSGDTLVRRFGIYSVLGLVSESVAGVRNVALLYEDENEAEFMFCKPDVGRLPSEQVAEIPEIALDRQLLEYLDAEATIGTVISLEFTVDGMSVRQNFRVSGYWERNELAKTYPAIVPLSFCEMLRKEYGLSEPLFQLGIMFRNSKQVEEQTKALISRYGYQYEDTEADGYVSYGVNPAVSESGAEALGTEGWAAVGCLLVVGILTGYLMISNLFGISVSNEIRFYGMMRTLGMTSSQIRSFVVLQGLALCALGIPIGLLFGVGIGNYFTKLIVLTALTVTYTKVAMNPIVFPVAAAFTVITVLISCMAPAAYASEVSPIVALNYTEADNSSTKRRRRRRKTTPLGLAVRYVCGKKWKAVKVILSLTFASILFQLACSMAAGFDMERFMQNQAKDFLIAAKSYFAFEDDEDKTTALAQIDELIPCLEEVEKGGFVFGVLGTDVYLNEEQINHIYVKEGVLQPGESVNWELFCDTPKKQERQMTSYSTGVYGMDDTFLEELQVLEGDLNALREQPNAKIIMVRDWFETEGYSLFQIGDTVSLIYQQDNLEEVEADYEICAIVDIPNSLTYRVYRDMPYFIVASEELLRIQANYFRMLYAFDCSTEAMERNTEIVKSYIDATGTPLEIETAAMQQKQLLAFKNTFLLVMGSLVAIIGLIGIMNLINILMTGISERRNEFAILQAVGMTGKQLCRMLISEGVLYTGTAFVGTILFVVLFENRMFGYLNNEVSFLSLRTSVVPVLVFLPVYILIGAVVPYRNYRQLNK